MRPWLASGELENVFPPPPTRALYTSAPGLRIGDLQDAVVVHGVDAAAIDEW